MFAGSGATASGGIVQARSFALEPFPFASLPLERAKHRLNDVPLD